MSTLKAVAPKLGGELTPKFRRGFEATKLRHVQDFIALFNPRGGRPESSDRSERATHQQQLHLAAYAKIDDNKLRLASTQAVNAD